MIITFLGTGTSQGVPAIGCQCEVCHSLDFRDKRLRTSAHIEVEGTSLIIDSGPDFRQQVLRNRIERLDALLYTHQHKDHVAGLDEIRGFNYLQGRAMPLYARQQVIEQLEQEFSYIFAEDKYPGIPKVDIHRIDLQPFHINNIQVIPIEVMHHRLPVLGFRIQHFTYITDASYISEAEKEKMKGSEVLVINALQHQDHISHFTLQEALRIIDEIQPRQAYLIHISHKLGLHREVSRMLPEGVSLAYDGLQLAL